MSIFLPLFKKYINLQYSQPKPTRGGKECEKLIYWKGVT